jgi:hypothetical protein
MNDRGLEQCVMAPPDRDAFTAAMPALEAHAPRRAARLTLCGLEAGKTSVIPRSFSDAKGGAWKAGESLTERSRYFLARGGGRTLAFSEGTVFIQGGSEVAVRFDENFVERRSIYSSSKGMPPPAGPSRPAFA